ncbi:hypothetical protein BD413DRAFT_475037 [Trametes elegans]|nr:hypothetical protein BD413DRAFT_475037 [Trametes elegans]
MSRHRFVRNININEELEDDAISDGGEDDLSPEDYDRMMDGLEHIRATLGDERQSALTDQDIKDSLYEYYFDVEGAITDLLDKQERRFAARERQEPGGKPLPPPPFDEEGDWSSTTDTTSGRHNLPFVRLTQSDYLSSSEQETTRASTRPGSLYTITELTERTEESKGFDTISQTPPPYLHAGGSRATIMSSVTTDYGQPLERPSLYPGDVSVSPSDSALHRVSYEEYSASNTPESRRTPESPGTTSASSAPGEVPQMDNIPDIPDYKSKSSMQRPLDPSEVSLISTSKKSLRSVENDSSAKKSKLSALASSRSSSRSSVSSVSTHSYTTETASDVTYPALRPSAASMVSLIPDKRLPSRPSTSFSQPPEPSERSSLSRIAQEALNHALALEALDREGGKEPTTLSIPTTRPPTEWTSVSSDTSTPAPTPRSLTRPASFPPAPAVFPSDSGLSPVSQLVPSGQPRQLSKLARLAKAKVQEQSQASESNAESSPPPRLILPRSRTEYLVPTANGPTATTAITTSYQSLGSLLTKDQSKLPPSVKYPAPVDTKAKSSEPKQSKLAKKSKTARSKPELEAEFGQIINPVVDIPIFSPKEARSRASPSAFASLLINDNFDPEEGDVTDKGHRRHKSDHVHRHHKEHGNHENKRHHKHKERDILPLPPTPLTSLRGFAFDVPSPDDIVFNARKGTSLAHHSNPTQSPLSAASSR